MALKSRHDCDLVKVEKSVPTVYIGNKIVICRADIEVAVNFVT